MGMRIRFLIIGVFLAASLQAASPEYQRASDLYGHTQYQQATAVLEKVAKPDADMLLLLGRAYFGAGDYSRATEVLEKAVEKAPESPQSSAAYAWLGRAWGRRAETSALWNQPRYAARSREAFEKSLQLDPNNRDALDDLSEFYLQAPGWLGGGIDKAEALAKRIASLDPAWGQIAYARIKEEQKDFVAAESHLRQAIQMAPRQVGKLLNLATFLAKRGRSNESDAEFAEAAKLAPNDPQVLFARAHVLVEQKRNPDEARQLLTQYLAANLTPDYPPRSEAQKLLQKISR